MNKYIDSKLCLVLGLCLYAGGAAAESNPRTMAMGGAGIAASYGKAAMSSNPAQMMSRKYTFDMGGGLGIETENAQKSIDRVDDLKDLVDELNDYSKGGGGKTKLDFEFKSEINDTNKDTVLANIGTGAEQADKYLQFDRYDKDTKTAYYFPAVKVSELNQQGKTFADKVKQTSAKLKELSEEQVLSLELAFDSGIAYGCLGCLNAYGFIGKGDVQTKIDLNIDNYDINAINSLADVIGKDQIAVKDLRDLKTDGYLNFTDQQLKSLDAADAAQQQMIAKIIAGNAEAAGATKLVINNPVGKLTVSDDLDKRLKSSAKVAGAVKGEVGFAYAKELELDEFGINRLHIGVMPKFVILGVTEKVVYFKDGDIDSDDFTFSKKKTLSADVGVSYKLPDSAWNFGAVIRNLIPAKVSANGTTAQIKPELAVGSAYYWRNVTLAADLDLNKYELIKNGGRAKQFLSLGAEVDFNRWLALRAGVQQNLASSAIGTRITAGFGLLSNTLQLSAYKASDELGGVFSTSIQF